jgi:hypothetical protein
MRSLVCSQETCYPLTLTLLTKDKQATIEVAERLLECGASCTAADEDRKVVLRQAVLAKDVEVIKKLIRVGPSINLTMDFLARIIYEAGTPLVGAIGLNERSLAALLISSEANVKIIPKCSTDLGDRNHWVPTEQEGQWLKEASHPVEPALAQRSDLVFPISTSGFGPVFSIIKTSGYLPM